MRSLASLLSVSLAFAVACEGRPTPSGDDDDGSAPREGIEGVDLTLDVADVAPSLDVSFRDFEVDACEVSSGCVVAPGVRALLSFDVEARNLGESDLALDDDNVRVTKGACACTTR